MSNYELKEKSMVDMFVTIEGEEWKNATEKSFDKLSKKVSIDGFRKGQAPKALLEKRIPKNELFIQAVEDNANDWMRNALKENDLNPISQPILDIKDVNDQKVDLVFSFAVMPEVKLQDYKGLAYEMEKVEVNDDEVNEEIDRLRNNYAEMEVKEDAADNGDTVNIDYKGFKDGEAFQGGEATNYDLVLGSNSFIPGFEDQLVGTKAGEEKDIDLTFPEDYHAEELKGAAVTFHVKVNEVKVKVLPELDDDFAKDLNMKDVESLDELKKNIQARIEDRKTKAAEADAENKLAEQLVDMVEADIPEVLVEDEIQGQINQLASQIQAYGMSLTQYLQMIGKDADSLKEDYKEGATKTVKMRLALQEIVKQENIEVSDEEIENELQTIADQYQMNIEDVKKAISPEMVRMDVLNQKAMQFVKDNAKKA
ncbi:MAG: trigger factor [Solobacterium sp.]|nr:trigger factor [Solobacterium sp.]